MYKHRATTIQNKLKINLNSMVFIPCYKTWIMNIELEITTIDDYFNKTNREVDWSENDGSKVPMTQAEDLQKILSCEVSIYMLRRGYNICESLSDSMINIRRAFIKEYEQKHEPYKSYNDYY